MGTTRPNAARNLGTRPPLRRFLWAIHKLRAGRPMKATDLAREFEINVRTAYRDLDFLRDSWRVPIEFDRGRNSYRLTEPYADLPPVSLSQGELIALYFAEKVVRQYRGTPFEADLVSAFRKIQDLLPQEVRVSPDALDAYLSLDLVPLRTPDAVYATKRHLLYVACTRARDHLLVTGVAPASEFLDDLRT